MKIALISDLHIGCRNDNISFLKYQDRYFKEYFFPYIQENNISTILIPGDLVDRRKYINFNTLNYLRTSFLQPLKDMNKEVHIICGNHDIYYKNTTSISALHEICKFYNFNIYHDPTEIIIDNRKFLFLPWIVDENKELSYKMIENSNASIVIGHLELQGYEMNKNHFSSIGMKDDLFLKFDLVCTGHYHHKSNKNNIHYLGAPYEITWADYNDPRGFHILDTDNLELTFIQNPISLFHKINYDDSLNIENINMKNFVDSYVKIIIKNKSNISKFEDFITTLESYNPIHIGIIEEIIEKSSNDDISNVTIENTQDIINSYISNIEIDELIKDKIKNKLLTIYNSALLEHDNI